MRKYSITNDLKHLPSMGEIKSELIRFNPLQLINYKLKNEYYKDIMIHKYQKDFIFDYSRFILIKKSRQIGMSFAVALKALATAYIFGYDVTLVSPTMRQSQRLTRYIRLFNNQLIDKFGTVCKFVKDNEGEIVINKIQDGKVIGTGAHILIAPASESNVRGSAGVVIIDEACWINNMNDIYSALLPSISSNKEFQLILISSVGTKEGLFYDIDEGKSKKYPGFRRYNIPITIAVNQGCELDYELIKANMDEDDFNREFMCQYSDDKLVFIGYDLIHSCEIDDISSITFNNNYYAGVDFARHTNLTVIFIANEVNGVLIQSEQTIELHKMTYQEQEEILSNIMTLRNADGSWKIKKLAFDSTGIGSQTGENLKRKFGYRVELIQATSEFNENLVNNLKRDMEEGKIKFLQDDKLRKDIHGIKKSWTKAGNVRFISDLNIEGEDKASHCDRFWAMGYCNYARYTRTPDPVEYKAKQLVFGGNVKGFLGNKRKGF